MEGKKKMLICILTGAILTWQNFAMVLQNGISGASCPSLFSEHIFSYDTVAMWFLQRTRVTESKRNLCSIMEDPLQPVNTTFKKWYL